MPTPSCRSSVDGQLELGADAVVGGDQQRVVIARRLQVEEAAEAAELGVGARPRGRLGERGDRLHQRIAGGDRDAGVGVGERLLGHGSRWPPSHIALGFPRHCRQKRARCLRRRCRPLTLLPAIAARSPLGGTRGRADGERRARHPADRQLGHARDHRHPCRCRRQGCRSRRATPAGASPSARASRRCGPRPTSARSAKRPTCPIRRSTGSSARSSSSASRSGPTATSPTSASCSTAPAPASCSASPGSQRRSAPMLLIPVMITRRHGDQRRAAQPVAARLGAVPHLAEPDRLCPGQRAGRRSAAGQRRPDAAAGPRLVAQHPRPLRRRRRAGRRGPRSTGSIRAGRPAPRSSAASGPTATARRLRADRQGQRRHSADDGRGRRSGWTNCSPRRSPPAMFARDPVARSSPPPPPPVEEEATRPTAGAAGTVDASCWSPRPTPRRSARSSRNIRGIARGPGGQRAQRRARRTVVAGRHLSRRRCGASRSALSRAAGRSTKSAASCGCRSRRDRRRLRRRQPAPAPTASIASAATP